MGAPELDRFLESLRATGIPSDDLPAMREAAATILRAAAGAPLRPIHVDEALRHARWRGADAAALSAIRSAGERLVAWQREAAAPPPATAAVEAGPPPAAAPEATPERFRWTATALQVCLAVALLLITSRVVSLEHASFKKTSAQVAIDGFLRQEREENAARRAAERWEAVPPGPVAKVRQPAEAAMKAFEAGRSAVGAGTLDEARREYTRAVAFEPSFTEAYVELAAVNLSLARKAAQSGERSDALRYFHDSLSDQRRARELASGDMWYLYGDASVRSYCLRRTAEALANAERLERDDTAALAALGWRPGGSRSRAYRASSHHASRRGYYSVPPAEDRALPGPARVDPSVVRPTRVRPSVVRPSLRLLVAVPSGD